ncbi:MAG: hypothetical protein O7A64_07185, partial [Alphaproteobacteria bacterium]|nr:hypothetical protein [Alphaproteobacteria bacterium]
GKVQPILDGMRVLSNETREEALAGLSPDQRDILIEGLVTIKDNLLRQEAAESEDDAAATASS